MKKRVAIVMPCYREEASLPHTISELDSVRKKLSNTYSVDIMLVNDGSPDDTLIVIKKLSKKYDNLFYRSFSKNVGHQSALRAGLDASGNYDAVIMMDADLQHPPQCIPVMLEAWESGYKIVQMLRDDSRNDVGFIRFHVGKLYYWLINSISDIKLEYGASDFRLIDKTVTEKLINSVEKRLFLRGYFSWLPVSRTTVVYQPRDRVAGTSSYNFKKLMELSYTSVLQFSEKPLRLSVSIGIIMAVFSFVYGAIIILNHLFGSYSPSGWTSLMTMLLFCFGINFILIGIIGHYLGHATGLLKQRPEYVVTDESLS